MRTETENRVDGGPPRSAGGCSRGHHYLRLRAGVRRSGYGHRRPSPRVTGRGGGLSKVGTTFVRSSLLPSGGRGFGFPGPSMRRPLRSLHGSPSAQGVGSGRRQCFGRLLTGRPACVGSSLRGPVPPLLLLLQQALQRGRTRPGPQRLRRKVGAPWSAASGARLAIEPSRSRSRENLNVTTSISLSFLLMLVGVCKYSNI